VQFRDDFSLLGVSADGCRIAIRHRDSILVLDTESGAVISSQEDSQGFVAASWTSRGLLVASRSDQDRSEIEMWDGETGARINSFSLDGEGPDCAFSPDGQHIVLWARCSEGYRRSHITGSLIVAYDVETGSITMTDHRDSPNFPRCIFSPDGLRIASLTSDRALEFLSAATHERVALLDGRSNLTQQSTPFPRWLISNLYLHLIMTGHVRRFGKTNALVSCRLLVRCCT
jgi:WD40 repeat protein